MANVYFLLIAVLQNISQISPLSPYTAIAPLVFVVSLSMLREAAEEINRYLSDRGVFMLPVCVNIYSGVWETSRDHKGKLIFPTPIVQVRTTARRRYTTRGTTNIRTLKFLTIICVRSASDFNMIPWYQVRAGDLIRVKDKVLT
jgi:hypothetical protein